MPFGIGSRKSNRESEILIFLVRNDRGLGCIQYPRSQRPNRAGSWPSGELPRRAAPLIARCMLRSHFLTERTFTLEEKF